MVMINQTTPINRLNPLWVSKKTIRLVRDNPSWMTDMIANFQGFVLVSKNIEASAMPKRASRKRKKIAVTIDGSGMEPPC